MKLVMPLIENNDPGEVVEIPTLPPLFTMKLVAVEDPMTNDGPVIPLELIES